ncbi:hypothetical protein AB833_04955 [Chromatiales bacterium (ex Bugula neritina AB1)]|nr:hypothetical protein AB833_04955 [Chromatiales bacterium (ex Bugula neritina AB1)]
MRVATTANLAEGNAVGKRVLAFYRTVAKGGTGTIVTEAMRMTAQEPFGPSALVIFDRSSISGLKRIADVCHAEGALLIGQLNMGGRQHLASRVMPYTIAPSAIACPRSGGVPHELSTREVREIIETYVMCAVHCIEAGMDGVEIHGAQGHLIQQFTSPYTNKRSDEYGGSSENRLRFAREILQQVRTRIGHQHIVGYRMGVAEFTDGGLDIEDTLAIAKTFCDEQLVDYLSLSQGNFNSIETHLPDRHWPILAYQNLHSQFKSIAGNVPVIASTRIQRPAQAEQLLDAGEADMVGMCRALLADPEWPKKARAGKPDDIRHCIACNQCWAWISTGEPIACATNPVAGREHLWPNLETDRAAQPRTVLVIGGGPGGLEAARVAAKRGHQVTLLEAQSRLGGRLKDVHSVPFHEEMRHLFDFLIPQVEKNGVTVKTNTIATVDTVLAAMPDHLVIATGATATVPAIPGDQSVPVICSNGEKTLPDRPGDNVIIVDEDGYYWTSAVAESVMAQGKRPIVVSRFFEITRELPMVSRIALIRQLDQHNAELKPNTEVTRINNGQVLLSHYMTARENWIEDVCAIVWVGSATANNGLANELTDAGFPKSQMSLVGDAWSPRRLVNALVEAHTAARTIGSRAP